MDNWSIQIPLAELVALQGLPARVQQLEADVAVLRSALDAARSTNSKLMELVGDLRRDLRKLTHDR